MKVLITASVQSHIAQFHNQLIDLLIKSGAEVYAAARDNLFEKDGIEIHSGVKEIFNIEFDRSPLSFKNIKAYKKIKNLINNTNFDIVHCNTPVVGILTRLASRRKFKKGKMKVFYTAHGFHFYKGAPILNWILYYSIEKILSRYTSKLITISDEDYNTALSKRFNCEIYRINGVGVDDEKFTIPEVSEIKSIREKNNFDIDDYIITCIGELNKNKNQIVLIETMRILIKDIGNIKVLLIGNGPLKSTYKDKIHEYNLENNVILTGYRSDIQELIKISDLGLSLSKREGLGLNVIETLLAGKPFIGSKNRGHIEILSNVDGCIVLENNTVSDLINSIKKVHSMQYEEKLSKYLRRSVEKYTLNYVKQQLKEIYELVGEDYE